MENRVVRAIVDNLLETRRTSKAASIREARGVGYADNLDCLGIPVCFRHAFVLAVRIGSPRRRLRETHESERAQRQSLSFARP